MKFQVKRKEEDPKLWAMQRIFTERKRLSKKLGIPFNITLEYLLGLETEVCPVFGYKLEWGSGTERSGSLDKIKPSEGYVEGNVVWMSLRANILKRDATKMEIQQLNEWFQKI